MGTYVVDRLQKWIHRCWVRMIYKFAFLGILDIRYTVTVDTCRGHSRQVYPQGRMKGTIEMTWYWIIQNVNVNSWEF